MNNLRTFLVLFFLFFSIQNISAKVECRKANTEDFYMKLEGAVKGKNTITIHLTSRNQVLYGHYFDPTKGMPITLRGNVEENGTLIIREYDDYDNEIGVFTGRFKFKNKLSGKWSSKTETLRFAFKKVDLNNLNVDLKSYVEEDCINREKYLLEPREDFQRYTDTICSLFELDIITLSLKNYKESLDKINQGILKIVSESNEENLTVEDALQSFHEYVKEDEFLDMTKRINVFSIEKDVLCLDLNYYVFSGGAHGMGGIVYFNYDLQTGDLINVNNSFTDNFNEEIRSLALTKFYTKYGNDGWHFDEAEFKLNSNVAIVKGGLLYQFNSYELGPYSSGWQSLFLSYNEIKHLIQEGSRLEWFFK